jgi:hypothetical protein
MTPTIDQTPPRVIVLATAPVYSAVIAALVASNGLVTLRPCDETGAASGPEFFVRVTPGSTPSDADITAAIAAGREIVVGNCRIDPDFVPPPPASVTQRQLRLQLLTLGVTDAAVRASLAGNEAGLIEWEFASEVRRDHRLVGQLGAVLGLTSAQIDDAFRAASLL